MEYIKVKFGDDMDDKKYVVRITGMHQVHFIKLLNNEILNTIYYDDIALTPDINTASKFTKKESSRIAGIYNDINYSIRIGNAASTDINHAIEIVHIEAIDNHGVNTHNRINNLHKNLCILERQIKDNKREFDKLSGENKSLKIQLIKQQIKSRIGPYNQLNQLTMVTADVNLLSKQERDDLVYVGYVQQYNGFNWITEKGLKVLLNEDK